MRETPQETQRIWATLRRVATETLERKRRLGQYAVVWKDGRPVMIGAEADKPSSAKSGTPSQSGRTNYDSATPDGQ